MELGAVLLKRRRIPTNVFANNGHSDEPVRIRPLKMFRKFRRSLANGSVAFTFEVYSSGYMVGNLDGVAKGKRHGSRPYRPPYIDRLD